MAIPLFQMATIGLLPSSLKIAYYRFRGAKIGKRVSLAPFSLINAKSIEIGDDSKIGFMSFITLHEGLKLGKRVSINAMVAVDTGSLEIDNDSVIMEQVIVGGTLTPRSKLKIGKRVKVFPHSFLNPTQEITIEDDVGIGGSNYIFTHGSWQNVLDGFSATFGPVHIKRGAWLPWRAFVTPNVTIGEDALITPGAVITQSIPDQGIAGGVPAKVTDMKGRHIRKLNNKYRFKLIRKILKEYVEYQCYLGDECDITSDEDNLMLISHTDKTIGVYAKLDESALPKEDIIVVLEKFPSALKQRLNTDDRIWFDLLGKETPHTKEKIATELRNYFSRYGIRFDILD